MEIENLENQNSKTVHPVVAAFGKERELSGIEQVRTKGTICHRMKLTRVAKNKTAGCAAIIRRPMRWAATTTTVIWQILADDI